MAALSELVTVAELALSGRSDAQICSELGLGPDALASIRKSKRYRQVETRLADALIESAAGRIAALAVTATAKLEKLLAVPSHNTRKSRTDGQERKICDVYLAREQRVAAVQVLTIALKIKTTRQEAEQEKELAALLAGESDDEE